MKLVFLRIAVIISIVPILVYAIGYHGPRTFSGIGELPPVGHVIENAKALSGTPYDPLMGMHGNIGADVGFIVCSDVPNIAFGLSGYSWKNILEDDYKKNSKFYNSKNGNKPGNPYFHRRARNLYSYFQANGKLRTGDSSPKAGDMAFYRKSESGYIAHVALVTEVSGERYMLMESAPKTLVAQEVEQHSPIERGWIFAGFGSVYE